MPLTARGIEVDPRTLIADGRLEPMQFTTGDVAVIGAGIALTSGTCRFPS
jgi:hypothetical protein